LIAALAIAAVACGPSIESRSFDPAVACTSADHEGRFAGAYPELEAALPTAYEGRPPTFRDSGRSCTPDQLGTLAEAGITEIHFAGANWDLGGGQALTVATFEADGLDAARMVDFYEAGARAANRTNDLRRSDTRVGDVQAERLDVLLGESGQTIVAWPEDETAAPGRVLVLLASDLGDARVSEILRRLGDGTFAAPPSAAPSSS